MVPLARILLCSILTSELFLNYQFQLKFLSFGEAFYNSLTRSNPLVFMYLSLIVFIMTITLLIFDHMVNVHHTYWTAISMRARMVC